MKLLVAKTTRTVRDAFVIGKPLAAAHARTVDRTEPRRAAPNCPQCAGDTARGDEDTHNQSATQKNFEVY